MRALGIAVLIIASAATLSTNPDVAATSRPRLALAP
jgi:hypothetical protein